MNRKLFTIGYTGFSIEQFVEKLLSHTVECLIDTREIAISRKKGFSKSALRLALEEAGIEYLHLQQLGSPRSDRHELRETRDYRTFFRRVDKLLQSDAALSQLQEAAEVAKQSRACLMCCCAQWELCHRRCLVNLMESKYRMTFSHLSYDNALGRAA